MAEEVRGTGIDVNAIAPGALNTRMLDEIIHAGPEKVGQAFYDRSLQQKQSGGTPLDKGADLALFWPQRLVMVLRPSSSVPSGTTGSIARLFGRIIVE